MRVGGILHLCKPILIYVHERSVSCHAFLPFSVLWTRLRRTTYTIGSRRKRRPLNSSLKRLATASPRSGASSRRREGSCRPVMPTRGATLRGAKLRGTSPRGIHRSSSSNNNCLQIRKIRGLLRSLAPIRGSRDFAIWRSKSEL